LEYVSNIYESPSSTMTSNSTGSNIAKFIYDIALLSNEGNLSFSFQIPPTPNFLTPKRCNVLSERLFAAAIEDVLVGIGYMHSILAIWQLIDILLIDNLCIVIGFTLK
jgi:hypothetical protein